MSESHKPPQRQAHDHGRPAKVGASPGSMQAVGVDAGDRPVAGDPIAEALRRLWASAEEEPIPVEFLRILDRADTAALDRAAGPPAGAGGAGKSR